MFRKTLIGLASAAALAAALGGSASTASAGIDDVVYGSYHCHFKWKWVKVTVWYYDRHGQLRAKLKWVKKKVKVCHYGYHR